MGAATGADCDKSGNTKCTKCNAGYNKNAGNDCVLNKCVCTNGDAATGADCDALGKTKKCTKCNAGYNKNAGNDCVINKCVCTNGDAATGKDCKENKASKCIKCKENFDLNKQLFTCTLRKCACTNGTPTTGAACPKTGASSCKECTTGFTMSKDKKACTKQVIPPTKASFCADYKKTCGKDYKNCATEFPKLAAGKAGDAKGNTQACRIMHLTLAQSGATDAADTHCPHASETGGGECVAPTKATFCADYKKICGKDYKNCATEFPKLAAGKAGDAKGNTQACRIMHL